MKNAIVSYIPALHRGYIDFFKKYPGNLYILGTDFIKEVPRMERDIRAIVPEEIKELLDGLGIFSKIVVLNRENLNELLDGQASIILPDEDVNRQFVDTYLKDKEVSFVSVFLRWDRQISTAEFEVPPDRIISEDELDREIIKQALEESQKSSDWWRQIGAVLIRDKEQVLVAHNRPMPENGTPNIFGDPRSSFDAGDEKMRDVGKFLHGEAGLIAEAAKGGISVEGTSLYVTTFPCPTCAKIVAAAGIKKVFYSKGYSLLDAEDVLRAAGVEIILVK